MSTIPRLCAYALLAFCSASFSQPTVNWDAANEQEFNRLYAQVQAAFPAFLKTGRRWEIPPLYAGQSPVLVDRPTVLLNRVRLSCSRDNPNELQPRLECNVSRMNNFLTILREFLHE